MGDDIAGPLACLKSVKPEMAALNSGSLNYLKITANGAWAWPPLLFANPVEKIKKFLEQMRQDDIMPECECFDTGMLRSLSLFRANGMLDKRHSISLVMGVASGMPANSQWLPLLIDEMPPDPLWQTIAIGREDVWVLHKKTCELGGNMRTGLEDTFYLPDGKKTTSNGKLIEALAAIARQTGREIANPTEARKIFGINPRCGLK